MKKLLIALLLLILPFSLFASDIDYTKEPFKEAEDYVFSYFDLTMGYGYTHFKYNDKPYNVNSINFGTGFGFVDYKAALKVGFGMGVRMDSLIDFWSNNTTINFLIGPKFYFPLNDYMNFSFIVGPSFNATGKSTNTFSIAPATDLALEFYTSSDDFVSFKVGTVLTGQIGIGEELLGLSVSPYVSMSIRSGDLSFLLLPLIFFND